jgi:hypothetical protein
MEKRYGESGQQKKVAELEKLNALMEQKFSLTERELSEQRAKLAEKDKDFKEAQKDGYALRMEIQQLKQQAKADENDHHDAIEELRRAHQAELQKWKQAEPSSDQGSQKDVKEEKKWQKDRQ